MISDTLTRRNYLQATGSVAFWGPFASGDDEERDPTLEYSGYAPELDDFPDHLTDIRFDEEELENYQPKLILTPEARSEMNGMYGWSCESEDYDVTAHYYWNRYNTQRSSLAYLGLDVDTLRIPLIDWEFGYDSHHLDHEPVIVFQNPDGTVDSVVTTGGHHYVHPIDGEWGNLTEDRVSGRNTHVNLVGIRPWNHHLEAPSGEEGSFVQGFAYFGSWLQVYKTWFRNGRYDRSADRAIVDPFEFFDDGEQTPRDHWWHPDELDARIVRNIRLRRMTDRSQLRIED